MDSNRALDIIENESTIVRIEQQRWHNHNFTHADFNPPAEGPSILATFDRAVAAQHLDITCFTNGTPEWDIPCLRLHPHPRSTLMDVSLYLAGAAP